MNEIVLNRWDGRVVESFLQPDPTTVRYRYLAVGHTETFDVWFVTDFTDDDNIAQVWNRAREITATIETFEVNGDLGPSRSVVLHSKDNDEKYPVDSLLRSLHSELAGTAFAGLLEEVL